MRVDMHEGGVLMGVGAPHEGPHTQHRRVSSAPSVASMGGASAIGGGGRVRVIRLVRRGGESFGFSLRGGREHGTGFFVSHVEHGSQAFLQGLRAGDQVLRVNNVCVEQALHREVTAMVHTKSSITLKVKSAGIIPVKEHRGDPLTWLVIDDDDELSDHGAESYGRAIASSALHERDLEHSSHHSHGGSSSSHSGSGSGHPINDVHERVFISCEGKVGLGCSICKGPVEKPGIFVQSVRPGGVAKAAGLRPGDQIIACNDVSFAHLEFAEAVYVLKSSSRLAVDVVHGAGLDLVAGESSGYNSSASSVAGDQTPPSSLSSDPRDSDHSITSRLSAVSQHLTLDRTRGWREIEMEWADAEAAEKRRQLQSSQRTLKTRAQRDANYRSGWVSSRSLGNIRAALTDEDSQEQSTAFREGNPCSMYARPAHPLLSPTHAHYKPTLRSTKSSSDVMEETNHKIALLTSTDPHVNNIVVTGGPKDERDAVSRLEQLSSPSASRTSTLSSGTSQVTVRSSSGGGESPTAPANSQSLSESLVEQQLRELREEQRRLQDEAHKLAMERQKFEEEKRRGLERTQSAPLAPLVITCSGQSLPSQLRPPPSPTSSISSGRHTTRVLIKSPPPPPPPRKNTTALSSGHSSFSSQQQVSPPASPAHSSSSSSGVGSSCGSGAPPRRCKSIGSLSASSGESTVWEEALLPSRITPANLHSNFRSAVPPPTPPKPPAPPIMPPISTPVPQGPGGIPPPPPPPPQQPSTPASQPSLSDALHRELIQRTSQDHLGLNGDEGKAQLIQDKIDAFKKEKVKTEVNDPKNPLHDRLIAEVKLKHKQMFTPKGSASEEEKEVKPATNAESHQKAANDNSHQKAANDNSVPTSQVAFSSKIISNRNTSPSQSDVASKARMFASLGNGEVRNNKLVSTKEETSPPDREKEIIIIRKTNNITANNKSASSVAASKERQQTSEQSRGSITSRPPLTSTRSPLRPTGATTNIEEFKVTEKAPTMQRPPSSYFEHPRPSPGKPLVSITAYPSPSHRPTPTKMEFLPSSNSSGSELNGVTKGSVAGTRALFQNELTNTLTRSNLRQRTGSQDRSPAPPSGSDSAPPVSATTPSFTTTTINNNTLTPNTTSLSNKYRGIGQDNNSSVTVLTKGGDTKEMEVLHSPPSGILKPVGPTASLKPLQKSISFGDVTTVGEDEAGT